MGLTEMLTEVKGAVIIKAIDLTPEEVVSLEIWLNSAEVGKMITDRVGKTVSFRIHLGMEM